MAPVPVPSCSGAFHRQLCRHELLFEAEYKRSNRNRGTKILRCFPHCCPQHVERSYCGSSVELTVQLHAPRQTTNGIQENLFVFAQFEQLDRDSGRLKVGQQVSLRHLQSVSQSASNPEAPWMQGVSYETQDGQNACVFVLNGQSFSKWYYHWESGANKTQRLAKHVLQAYVFYRLPAHSNTRTSDVIQVIGIVSSPPFTVVSYRRSTMEYTNHNEGLEEGCAPVVVQYPPTDKSAMDPALQRMVQHHITQAFQAYQQPATIASSCCSSKRSSPRSQTTDPVDVEPSLVANASITAKQRAQWIWERQHEAVLQRAKELAILFLFAENLSVGVLEALPAVQSQLQHAMKRHWAWTPSAPPVFGNGPKMQQPHEPSMPLQSLLIAVSKLVVWSLSKDTMRWLHQLIESHRTALLQIDQLRHGYLHCVNVFYERMNSYVSGRTLAIKTGAGALRRLSDTIIGFVYSNPSFASIRPHLRSLLEARDAVGWSSFVAQVREAYLHKTHSPLSTPSRLSFVNGGWRLAADRFQIHCANATMKTPSLWSTLLLLSQMTALEIQCKHPQSLLIRCNVAVVSQTHWMKLVCDQTPRILRVVPNGLASLVSSSSRCFGGDYIAKYDAPQDRFAVELYWWPYPESGTNTAFRIIVTLAQHLTTSLQMTLSIEGGPVVHLADDVESWSPQERLQMVQTWSRLWRVVAHYNAM